jgi:hypothetical protein
MDVHLISQHSQSDSPEAYSCTVPLYSHNSAFCYFVFVSDVNTT